MAQAVCEVAHCELAGPRGGEPSVQQGKMPSCGQCLRRSFYTSTRFFTEIWVRVQHIECRPWCGQGTCR